MAINTKAELQSTLEALAILYSGLEALRMEFQLQPNKLRFLAEGPLDEIHRLEADLDAYATGFGLAERVPLWMTLSGGLARWTETPSRILSGTLDSLRKGVQAITTFDLTGKIGLRPSQRVLEASDPEVLSLQSGSLRIGLRWHQRGQDYLFDSGPTEEDAAVRAIQSLLRTIQELDKSGSYAMITEDHRRRRVLLRAVAELAPSTRSEFDVISFSGAQVPGQQPLLLSSRTRESARAALREAVAPDESFFEGEIRELDLDKKTFKLRGVAGAGEVSCNGEALEFDRVIRALGVRVRVFGAKSSAAPRRVLKVLDFEPLEGDSV